MLKSNLLETLFHWTASSTGYNNSTAKGAAAEVFHGDIQ